MEKSTRTRLFTAGVLAVVFGAGIVLGMALRGREPGTGLVTGQADSTTTAQSADSTGRRHRQPFYMQVDPTPEQKARLDSIFKVYRDSMQALNRDYWRDYRPHSDSLRLVMDSLRDAYRKKYDPRQQKIFDSARAAIRAVLTPAQAVKWDSLRAKWRHDDSVRVQTDRSRRRGDRGGGRGDHAGGREGSGGDRD